MTDDDEGTEDRSPPLWEKGQTIAGKFRLEREIGRGGMGAVWEAHHLSLGCAVAIKLIDEKRAKSRMGTVRFVREAKASAALRSPHVVQILDHGVDDGTPYIAMEMLEGDTLAERLDKEGRLTNVQTVRVVTHIARALTKAREHDVVHRDLKPENVFIVQNMDEEVVKVLDFGVAKQNVASDDTNSVDTKTGSVIGTPRFMSPEQARGKTLDWRSDLWALAIIAYRCHVGQLPFEGSALGELIMQICSEDLPVPSQHADVNEGFDEWFAKAANRNPDERFQTARELATSLAEVLVGAGAADPSGRGLSTLERYSIVGTTDSGESAVPSGLGRTIQSVRPTQGARNWLLAGGGVAALAVAAYLLWPAGAPAEAPKPATTTPVATATATATATASASAESPAAELTYAVQLTIVPAEARVSVGGARVGTDEGVLTIQGQLGSVYDVEVSHEGKSRTVSVAITEEGPRPEVVELEPSEK